MLTTFHVGSYFYLSKTWCKFSRAMVAHGRMTIFRIGDFESNTTNFPFTLYQEGFFNQNSGRLLNSRLDAGNIRIPSMQEIIFNGTRFCHFG